MRHSLDINALRFVTDAVVDICFNKNETQRNVVFLVWVMDMVKVGAQ